MCQGGVAGGVTIGPQPSYGPEGGDKVEVMEPAQGSPWAEQLQLDHHNHPSDILLIIITIMMTVIT